MVASTTCMLDLAIDGPLDLVQTLGPLQHGARDPTIQITARDAWRTSRTPEGPATLHLAFVAPDRVRAQAWGPGADWMLARAAALLGLEDVSERPSSDHPLVAQLARHTRGLRLARTHRIVELLVPIVLEQLVSGAEAKRAFAGLLRRFGVRAPGPRDDLLLPVAAEDLASLTSMVGTPLGILAKQGATLRRIGEYATKLEAAATMSFADADRRLRALPGIGPWTAGMAMLYGMGHPDAIPLGDYGIPSVVAWNFAGERDADDARMLELLAPWTGQRGRLIRWIGAAGAMPERRGPRMPMRPLPRG